LGLRVIISVREVVNMNKWNVISGLIPLIILAAIFALPIKTVPVQTTESYWDIEMRSEPYTETEAYTESEPYTTTETYQRSVYAPNYYPYNYPYNNYPYNYPYYGYGGISPTDNVKCQGYPPYCVACSGDELASCRIWSPATYYVASPRSITDTREVVKYRTVTKYRDVTKYHQVPTKVLKERTVAQQVRMSVWEYLFR
jgi:hypothetical protein